MAYGKRFPYYRNMKKTSKKTVKVSAGVCPVAAQEGGEGECSVCRTGVGYHVTCEGCGLVMPVLVKAITLCVDCGARRFVPGFAR